MLNADTKFYISQVLDSGYVIRVWYFNDSYTPKTTDGTVSQPILKKDFYAQITGSAPKLAAAKRTIDSANHVLAVARKTVDASAKNLKKATTNLNNVAKAISKKAATPTEGNSQEGSAHTIVNLQTFAQHFSEANDSIANGSHQLLKGVASDMSAITKPVKHISTLQDTLKKKNAAEINVGSIAASINAELMRFTDLAVKSTDSVSINSTALTTARKDSANAINTINDVRSRLGLPRSPDAQVSTIPKNDTIYRILKPQLNMPFDDLSKDTLSLPANDYDRLAFVDSWGNYMEFFMPTKSLTDCAQIYPKSDHFTWGFLSVPIKIRVAPFNFEQNVNFGFSLGWKWQPVSKTDIAHDLLFGIAVGSVNVVSSTVSTTTTSSTTTPTTAPAISLSFGYMFQYDKFQAGAFAGWDIASPPSGYKFVNAKSPWIGIAIGMSLFGENKTAATAQNQ